MGQSCLSKDALLRFGMQLVARVAGDRDRPRFPWMTVMPVAPSLTHKLAAVPLDQLHRLADLHDALATDSALLGANASASSFASSPGSRWWM
jgi:hypothetical protein